MTLSNREKCCIAYTTLSNLVETGDISNEKCFTVFMNFAFELMLASDVTTLYSDLLDYTEELLKTDLGKNELR